MKKVLLVIVSLFLAFNIANAQKSYKSVDLFLGFGVNEFNFWAGGIGLTYGLNFNNYLSLGLGLDCRYVNDLSSSEGSTMHHSSYLLVPAHIRFKANFGTKEEAPFFMFDAGYAYNFWNLKSVVLFEPSFGVTYKDKITVAAGVIIYPAEYIKAAPINSYSSVGYGPVEGVACTLCVRVGFFIK